MSDDLLDLVQEPGVDLGELEYLLHGHAGAEPVGNVPDPLPVRHADLLPDVGEARADVPSRSRRDSNPYRSISRDRSAFWSDSLKVLPMDMASPTDFICVVSVASAWGNFSKANRGNLTTT